LPQRNKLPSQYLCAALVNVRWIISVAAVGSLQEKYAPRNVVLPSQFYDRTSQRALILLRRGASRRTSDSLSRSANLRNLVVGISQVQELRFTMAAFT